MGEVSTRCTRCVMPDTWRGLTFDEHGVCSQCRTYDERRWLDWAERERDFRSLIVEPAILRASWNDLPYDCVVGFSGGKDSTWVLYRAVRYYGLRPLAVTFDHGFRLDEVSAYNLRELPKVLGVDHITMTVGNELRNRMVRLGLQKAQDFCVHCHRGVGAFTAQVAEMYDIRLVLWGEPGYTDLEEGTSGEAHFHKWFDCGLGVLGTRETRVFDYPKDALVHDVYLGNYEWWDQWQHAEELEREIGWRRVQRFDVPEVCSWDKVDCVMEPVRGWQGLLRSGVGRLCFDLSKAIRAGKMTRDEAMEVLQRMEGRKPVDLLREFSEETGVTEREFMAAFGLAMPDGEL